MSSARAARFDQFQLLNAARCNTAFAHGVEGWDPEYWALAIAGEAGELCNLLKKVVRGDFTLEEKRQAILSEVADVITYCDLLNSNLHASTGEELMRKFNEVSKRIGYSLDK